MTNFELGVHIPLIIRAPWIASSIGQETAVLAEVRAQFCDGDRYISDLNVLIMLGHLWKVLLTFARMRQMVRGIDGRYIPYVG